MRVFQAFLVLFLVVLGAYTAKVIAADGLGLLPIFFGDIAEVRWPGQFNFDFLGFLMLSALWTAWRSKFSLNGLGLSVLAFFLGMGFLCVYLLVLTVKHSGDMRRVLLGEHAAA